MVSGNVLILGSGLAETGMAAAVAAYLRGDDLRDIIAAGMDKVENNPELSFVGIGGSPNMLGRRELDGAYMEGSDCRFAAIGAITEYSPFRTALEVLDRLPHNILTGMGASRFAKECGLPPLSGIPERVETAYEAWRNEKGLTPSQLSYESSTSLSHIPWGEEKENEKDTVTFSVLKNGILAVGTSTSGWDYKYPGRLGDSPIPGAGFYANKVGACTCTHTGELTTRASTSFHVAYLIEEGNSVQKACEIAMEKVLKLQSGYIGPIVIHAMDRDGAVYVLTNCKEATFYWIWDGNQIQQRQAVKYN